MAEAEKFPGTTETHDPPYHTIEPGEAVIPRGWKYNSIKLGRVIVPWYASPESQLILVSFVCFLCPGKCHPAQWTCEFYFLDGATTMIDICNDINSWRVSKRSCQEFFHDGLAQEPISLVESREIDLINR